MDIRARVLCIPNIKLLIKFFVEMMKMKLRRWIALILSHLKKRNAAYKAYEASGG